MKKISNILLTISLALFSAQCLPASAQDVWLDTLDLSAGIDSIEAEQDYATDMRYSFVNYEADSLVFPAGISDNFKHLFLDLGDLVTGIDKRVNIMHIGGSHVQADVFSHRMRTNLSYSSFPAFGARGCLFPFRALNTNAPSSYSLRASGRWQGARNIRPHETMELGIMGAAVTTTDTNASLSLQLNTDLGGPEYDFNSIILLGEALSPLTFPVVVLNGDTIMPSADETDVRRLKYSFLLPYNTTHCEIFFRGITEESPFTLRGIIPENDTPGVSYTAAGINGASVPSWLSCELFTEELKIWTPQLVIFGIGINDASTRSFSPEKFKAHYLLLIDRIRQANPDCCFIFLTNNDCFLNLTSAGKYINPNTKLVQKAFYELAQETQGAVFDVFEIMGGHGSSNRWVSAGFMNKDHVHFTASGYKLMGDMLFDAINAEVIKIYNQ